MLLVKAGEVVMINFLKFKNKKDNKNSKKTKNNKGNFQLPSSSAEKDNERTTILDINNFQVIESYKQLRTNVMFAMSAKDVSVVEFSSSFPGEGKSITSANMAIAMAQTGAKVLLIDCDLRKSVQHKVFKLDNKVGLSSILGKMASLEDVVHKNVAENLDLIAGGPVPPNPSELIASKNMEVFIDKVKEVYDYVIIDTPPINIVSDALELSQYTGGLVLVTRQGVTTYDDVRSALQSAKFLNVNILGLVINGIKEEKFKSYGKYGKYKKYGKYSSYGYK